MPVKEAEDFSEDGDLAAWAIGFVGCDVLG